MNWKGQVANLLVIWLLPGFATALLLFLLRTQWPERWGERAWKRFCVVGYVLSRVAFAAVLYGVFRYGGSGDAQWYYGRAEPLLDGAVLGRDSPYAYGPLLGYAHALGIAVLPGRPIAGIILPALVAEALLLYFIPRLGRLVQGEGGARWLTAWLVATPLLWHQSVLRGEEEVIFLSALVLGSWLLCAGRPLAGGAALGLGFCATKVTFGPYALVLLLVHAAWTRWRDLRAPIGFTGICALVYVPYWLRGADPLGFLASSGRPLYPSLSSVVADVFPAHRTVVELGVYTAAAVAAVSWAGSRRRDESLPWHCISAVSFVQAACILFQPYVTVNYAVQALAFSLLVLRRHGGEPLAKALLTVLPVIGFCITVSSESAQLLYAGVAVPGVLAFHGLLLVFLFRDLRPAPATVGPPREAV